MRALVLLLPLLAACATEAEPLPADLAAAGETRAPDTATTRTVATTALPRLPLGKRPLAPGPVLPDEPVDPSFITVECEPDETVEDCKKLCVVLTDVHDDNFYYYPADHTCKDYLTSEADF